MSSSYYASSSSFSQINNEPPKTSQNIFSMNQDTENISGFYKQLENDKVINNKSFNSLEGLKNVLLEFQNNQHVLRDKYQQTLTDKPSLSGGNMQNIPSFYKKHGGTLKKKTNPIEKINPNQVITNQNYIKSLY